jgi:hypothetical protein
MKYKGHYFGWKKIIVCFWDEQQNDWTEIVEMFNFKTPIKEIELFCKELKKKYPNETIKAFKETWQGKDWSDYETIKINWNR